VFVSALYALFILIDAHLPVILIDQDRDMPSEIGILIDQDLYRHRGNGRIERFDGGLFDIPARYIAPCDQSLSDHLIRMALAGNFDRIDAIKAVQTEAVPHSGGNHFSAHILDGTIADTDIDADREQWHEVLYRKLLRFQSARVIIGRDNQPVRESQHTFYLLIVNIPLVGGDDGSGVDVREMPFYHVHLRTLVLCILINRKHALFEDVLVRLRKLLHAHIIAVIITQSAGGPQNAGIDSLALVLAWRCGGKAGGTVCCGWVVFEHGRARRDVRR